MQSNERSVLLISSNFQKGIDSFPSRGELNLMQLAIFSLAQ